MDLSLSYQKKPDLGMVCGSWYNRQQETGNWQQAKDVGTRREINEAT